EALAPRRGQILCHTRGVNAEMHGRGMCAMWWAMTGSSRRHSRCKRAQGLRNNLGVSQSAPHVPGERFQQESAPRLRRQNAPHLIGKQTRHCLKGPAADNALQGERRPAPVWLRIGTLSMREYDLYINVQKPAV